MSDIDYYLSPSYFSNRKPSSAVLNTHLNVIKCKGTKVRHVYTVLSNIAYGTKRKKFDIYFPAGFEATDYETFKLFPPGCAVLIYIHGGMWEILSKEACGTIVDYVCPTGKCFVVAVGYDLIPSVGLSEIINEIKEATHIILKWALENCNPVILVGHSSGAHLCCTLLYSDIEETLLKQIKAVVMLAGIFDLTCLLRKNCANALKLTDNNVVSLSPMFNRFNECLKNSRFYIFTAQYESPLFKNQSKTLYQKLKAEDFRVKFKEVKEHDHFTLIDRIDQIEDVKYAFTNIFQESLH